MLRRIYGAGRGPELLFELPPLHRPSLKVLWWISWDYSKHFLRKAGLIIFGLSIVVWVLTSYGPSGPITKPQESFSYIVGRASSPILAPLGIQGEEATVVAFALLTGLVAKEMMLSSLAMIEGSADPIAALKALNLVRSQALALTVLSTIYMPCIATIAEMYRELGSVKATLLATLYMLATAFIVGYTVYLLATLVEGVGV